MNLNETIIRCDKCKEMNHRKKEEDFLNQSSEDDLIINNELTTKTTPNSSHKKQPKSRIAIAKCLDCNITYCSDCLLEHQLDNLDSSHKLIHLNENLTSSNNLSNNSTSIKEINNNNKKEINQNELAAHGSNSNKSSPTSSFSPKKKSLAQNQMANILNSFHMDDINGSGQAAQLFNDSVSLIKRRLNPSNENCDDLSSATMMTNALSNLTNKLQSNNNNLQQQQQQQQQQSSTLYKYQQLQKQQMYQKQMQLHQIKQSMSSNTVMNGSLNSSNNNSLSSSNSNSNSNSSSSNSTGHEANKLIQIEAEIQKTYNFYLQTLKERKDYLIKELNTITQYALINHTQNINKQIQIQYQLELKKQQMEKEIENEVNDLKLILSPNKTSIVNEENNNPQTVADLTTLNTKLTNLNELNNLILINNQLIAQLKANNPLNSIEFISNFSAIQTSIRNTFGYIRINKYDSAQNLSSSTTSSSNNSNSNNNLGQLTISCNNVNSSSSASAPITALSTNSSNTNGEIPSNLLFSKISNLAASTASSSGVSSMFSSNDNLLITSPVASNKKHQQLIDENNEDYGSYLLSKNQNEETISENNNKITLSASSTGSSKSSKSNSSLSSSNSINISQLVNSAGVISAANGSNTCYPRSKMIYHCKFGEFGINDGQFTEPSGVTINTNNDIIVADTNSHRIQIFDKDGRFRFKFGECGKRDGQLLYPNRVSIIKQTGDIVVTERSPTHQIQIYNKYGQFLRKFGANILQHPRGVCVDYKGRIIVVECKVMRVIIFDVYGNVLQKFNCSKYLEFPNGVCCSNPLNNPANPREEIYISDNRAHCIKVFDYNGNFIRQIGCEGLTNYPIGVGINSNNEILVADNHNNFNLTVFTQDGKLINALESKVKHAQCFDVGLMDDGSIVLASKDYRIYVYKYVTNSSNQQQLTASNSSSNLLSANNIGTKLSEDDLDLNVYNNNQDQKVIDSFDLFGGNSQTANNLMVDANYELNERENNEAAANLLLSSLASQIGLI